MKANMWKAIATALIGIAMLAGTSAHAGRVFQTGHDLDLH